MAVKAERSKAADRPRMRVDPITFEILRHRLWSINEEGANTLERVSGSLIASEVHDMNTSIMTATGDSLVPPTCWSISAAARQASQGG